MEAIGAMGGGFGFIILLALGIGWFFMPFAIFGTKPILRKILEESITQRLLLEKIAKLENQEDLKAIHKEAKKLVKKR